MINESKGHPDIVSKIINDNYNSIINNIDSKNKLLLVINESNLYCNLNINFNNGVRYSGNLNFVECISSKFNNCIINIFFPKKHDINLIIKSLSHELTHLYELYQVKYIYSTTQWKRSEALYNTSNQNVNSLIKYFRDIFYLSLPQEINARVSSLYLYLSSFDVDIEKKLKNTIEWDNYRNLKDFDSKILYNDLIVKFHDNKDILYFIFNEFNKNMKIESNIKNDEDLFRYLNKCEKYFNKVSVNYRKKIFKLISRILEEKSNKIYLTEETKVINYKDYVKLDNRELRNQNLENLISINYLDFLIIDYGH